MTPEIENKRRELFEAFYMTQDQQAEQHLSLIRDDGKYGYHCTRVAWGAFNAALDAVLIELPDACSLPDDAWVARYQCAAAITATGLGLRIK